MKRVIKASQHDIGDDYLQAKHYIDQAMQAMTYLQLNAENQADAKMFSGFGAQLAQMSGKLQGYLNLHSNDLYDIDSNTEITSSDDEYPRGYFDEYFGKTDFEEYGDLVSENCAGMIISKRADDGEKPGGLIYEAERLGIEDFFDLLRCLEGMCYNGTAVEISDYQYKVL